MLGPSWQGDGYQNGVGRGPRPVDADLQALRARDAYPRPRGNVFLRLRDQRGPPFCCVPDPVTGCARRRSRPCEVILELPKPACGIPSEADPRVGGPEGVPVYLRREQGRDVLASLKHGGDDLPHGGHGH